MFLADISGSSIYRSQVWEQGEALVLQPSDFSGGGPDFSDQGGEIFFGFLRSNSTAAGLTTTHGIDDWRVEFIRVQN